MTTLNPPRFDESGPVMDADPVLSVSNLCVEIETPRGTVHPVDKVSLRVRSGETLGIVGESGSGKTMTGMSIIKLLPPTGSIVSGSIEFCGTDLAELSHGELRKLRGNDIAMVFQDPMSSLNPTRTVGSQMREAYRLHNPSASKADADKRAIEVLNLVRMPNPGERLRDFPHQLSGGMRQRAMIAMALLCDPKLLIADEPTTALDVSIQSQILDLIDDLKTRLGMSVILVTHDLGVIAQHADRVAVMYAGQIIEEASTDELFTNPRHRYTQALLESMPRLDLDSDESLASIPGVPPQLIDLPPMCRFAERCLFASETCRTSNPPLTAETAGHTFACFHPRTDDRSPSNVATSQFRASRDTEQLEARQPLLQVMDVEMIYKAKNPKPFGMARRVHAVSGISLDVLEGETLGIVGESGSGKSTLGRMLVGLEKPTAGNVFLGGQNLHTKSRREWRENRRELQMMFQDSSAALDPRMVTADLIAEPLAAQGIGSRAERAARVCELLDAVGLPQSAAQRKPHEFSGGQRQRIAMARALILRPKIVVADEPVSALDVSVQAQILNLMRELQVEFSLTYVVISHDLALLKYMADRIGVLYLGKLVEIGASNEIYTNPRHPYTAGLINSIPSIDVSSRGESSVHGLPGEIASALEPPSGCRFRTRCALATDTCAEIEPLLDGTQTTHAAACHYPLAASTS